MLGRHAWLVSAEGESGKILRSASDHRADVEVEHRVQRRGVSPQTAPQSGTLPAVDQKVCHLPHVTPDRDFTPLPSLIQAGCHAFGD
jgi:hypothetical protein